MADSALHTPLYAEHLAAGGKIVDFAGWALPIHYGSQLKEHETVRSDAGMFDVSHMCVVDLAGARTREFLRHLPPTLERLIVVATAIDLEALAKELPRLKALRALRIEGNGIYTDPHAMDKVLCALKKDGPISVSVGACTHVGILAFFENNPAYNTSTFERRGPIEPLLREKKLDMSIAPDRRDDFVRDLIEEFGAKLREKTDLFDCVTIDGEPFTRTEMFRNALRIADGLAAIDATVEAPDA